MAMTVAMDWVVAIGIPVCAAVITIAFLKIYVFSGDAK